MKGPRHNRPLRPRSLAQRKLRPGLPPTVALRKPVAPAPANKKEAAPPEAPKAAPAAAPTPPNTDASNALLLRGEYWELRYGGRSAMVEDCRGLRYIALLIQQAAMDPRPVHARELVALATGRPSEPIELEAKDDLLDNAARRQLLGRLEEIVAERDRACAAEQFEKAERLDAEYERIAAELSRASAGGGRRGAFSDAGEKARKAVGKAIAEAVARVAAHKEVAALAEHLGTAIRKGQWLSYSGSLPWTIDFRSAPPRK